MNINLPDELCRIINSYNGFIHEDGIKSRRIGVRYGNNQPKNKNKQRNMRHGDYQETFTIFRNARLCDKHNSIQLAKSIMRCHNDTQRNDDIVNEINKLIQDNKKYHKTDIVYYHQNKYNRYQKKELNIFEEKYIKYWANNYTRYFKK